MPRYALKLEYDGSPFAGWQAQDGLPTVQGAMEAALARLEPDPGRIAAAGRTDAGVHATAQVAHADLTRDWSPFRLSEALNHHLKPAPVAVTAAARVPGDFHARFSALGRRYRYRLISRRAPLVHDRGRAWHMKAAIDLAAMREAAAALVGSHDFTTFRSSECQAKSPVKSLDRIDISEAGSMTGREITFDFAARSFLHNQVRSMVGTLVQVGTGRWPAARVAGALAAADRAACGPVAPPAGLFLTAVDYRPDPFQSPSLP